MRPKSWNDRAYRRSKKERNAGQLRLGVDEVDAFGCDYETPIDPQQAVLDQRSPGALRFETVLKQEERRGNLQFVRVFGEQLNITHLMDGSRKRTARVCARMGNLAHAQLE
jgi:hypothetical protein